MRCESAGPCFHGWEDCREGLSKGHYETGERTGVSGLTLQPAALPCVGCQEAHRQHRPAGPLWEGLPDGWLHQPLSFSDDTDCMPILCQHCTWLACQSLDLSPAKTVLSSASRKGGSGENVDGSPKSLGKETRASLRPLLVAVGPSGMATSSFARTQLLELSRRQS